MNTQQILRILKVEKIKEFVGVYPCDKLPKITPPATLVANIDPASKPGKHWVVLYIDHDGSGDYFDSYGLPPLKVFKNYLHENCNNWVHNTHRVQGPLSSVCGQFCIYFIVHRARDIPLKAIVDTFDKNNLVENDEIVSGFVNQRYNTELETYDLDFIVNQIAVANC